ncbi:tubulin-specific chaperone C-like [Palaemon carinicauda]|uniref:tubulin-specific chaperone C-like n=1 Tax=Palaemon carinicauda TaxID=392227 RepID=UPI0035B5FA31
METNKEYTPDQLLERMKQRTDAIAQKAEQRRTEKTLNEAASENVDYFYDTFQGMKEDLEMKIKQAGDVEKTQLIPHLDSLVKDLQKIQQFHNESSMFLASFQIKKAQEHINELESDIFRRIQELQPKKRFGFGKKNTEKKDKSKELKLDKTDSGGAKLKSLEKIIERQFYGFKDLNDETLTKSASELENRQFNLQNLSHCKVVALGNPSTLQFASLNDCIVIVGPTSRSAFIKDCVNCKFVIACQQVRIHNSKDTDFYLHVTGAAIIENCHSVRFAPYTLKYPELGTHYKFSGLDLDINLWDKIDDFHWLNKNEKSPNWDVIPENRRETDWL